jgi:hypothetical protein
VKSLVVFLSLAAIAPASPLATCTIYRWSQQSRTHEIAMQDSNGGCRADFSEEVTFPSGTNSTIEKTASVSIAVNNSPDELGFYTNFQPGNEPDSGYVFYAWSSASGNRTVPVGALYPGETTDIEYAYGVAEASFEFYRRTFTITNPLAMTAGFEAAPTVECHSNSLGGRGHCSVDWSVAPITLTGDPFTVVGSASVVSNGEQDAKDADLVLSFRDPAAYTFAVRDGQGNLIPESEWLAPGDSPVPEPDSIALMSIGIMALWLKCTMTARILRAFKALGFTH